MNPPRIPHSELTARSDGMIILDKNKERIGCTVRLTNGSWAAWSMGQKIGEYPSPVAAENAVLKAPKPTVRKAPRPRRTP